MTTPLTDPPEPKLESHEIRDLAVRGVAALGLRTLIIRVMGLSANLVLARLLTPHDFGLMAFGLAVVALGAFITDGGLGAALLRLEQMRRRQLEAVFGAQLLLASGTAMVIVAIAAPMGTAGAVAAIMALSLPLDCAKVPGALSCERRLNYTPIVRAEVAEMLVYNIVAVTAVALGAGIWGIAAAVPCRALVGAIVLTQQSGVLVRPRLLWGEARELYRFGMKFQGIGLVSFARDQGLNVATTAIAGFAALGTMSLVQRLTQPIWLVFDGSWRVSFPAMSRLRDAGRDVPAIAVRTLRIASMTTGFATVGVASATPALVPSLFGEKWNDVIPVMPIVLATLLIGGPMLACASGFFATIGEPGKTLKAEIAGSIVAFVVALPLLPLLGAVGLATGTFVATLASAAYLARDLRPHGIRVGSTLARSTAISVLAAAVGWLLADALPPTLWAAAAGGFAGCLVYSVLVWAFQREPARDALALARRALPGRPAAAQA
jgi:O-antigen/teichoic acid export membrane protein